MTPESHSPQEAPEAPEVLDSARSFVREQLEAGVRASALSFAMTYVAAELGLAVATDRADVYRVILSAITAASEADDARRAVERVEKGDPIEPEAISPRPAGVTVH